MLDLTLSTELRAEVRDAARDATIAAARAFGFGGSTWQVERPSGAGIGERIRVPVAGTVQALCFRTRPSAAADVAGGAPALDERWEVIVLAGDVQARDVLVSTVDATEVRVQSLEAWYDYQRGTLEQGI